jgi:transmembrane sensor
VTETETAKEIEDVAAEWAVRIEAGDLTAEEQRRLDLWLGGDTRRSGALMRAWAFSIHTDRAQALGDGFDPAKFKKAGSPQVSRRQLLLGTSAAAASLGGILISGALLVSQAKAYQTKLGESKVVALADGSVINLNTETAMKVAYSNSKRHLELQSGEALFEVEKDEDRPFIVRAGNVEITAVGTSFSVSHIQNAPIRVIVMEGLVAVKRLHTEVTSQGVQLEANMMATIDDGDASRNLPISTNTLSITDVDDAIAWRKGLISFKKQTLREAANAYRRYSDIQIVVDDPVIADEQITGLFQANDPVGFSRAVASSLQVHMSVRDKEVHLFR